MEQWRRIKMIVQRRMEEKSILDRKAQFKEIRPKGSEMSIHRILESRTVWVGGDIKAHLLPTFLQ